MMFRNSFIKAAAPPILFSLTLLMLPGNQAIAMQVKNNVPAAIQQGTDQGPIGTEEEMNVTVHLKIQNKEAFDKAVAELYDPTSPRYEHWMTDAELRTYGPSPNALAVVRKELEKNGLAVVSVDPLGFSIRVHGTAGNVQQAFQTQIHQYVVNNKTFRTHVQEAHLAGAADSFVASVSGLDGGKVHPMIRRAVNPRTGIGRPGVPVNKVNASGGLASIITDICFTGPKTFTFTTPGAALPVGVYFGNDYDDTPKVCAFTSAQLQAHYGLPAAYAKGLDGTGQAVVLLEAYGYPTILEDGNEFSKLSGLPALNSSNFEVIYPEGKPRNPNAGVELGWDVEIALDVQWAHTIAPKAKIIVVAAAGQDNEDLQDAINYVVNHHLANSVSNSWEADSEQFAGPDETASFNVVMEKAAAKGISVNFSSGDGGDDGNGSPIGSPEVPSDSPFATAVGGTAILNKFYGSTLEVGWGNAVTLVDDSGPLDPPLPFGPIGGAGGGESVFFSKPKWQAALPGTGRQVPDVAALADPYTGVSIVVTQSGIQYLFAGYGGTSLSCPIFSAFWALANQSAGHALGQAAPRLAKLSGKELIDIVPESSPTNIAGTIFDSNGPTYYSPAAILSFGLDPGTTKFITAMWPLAPGLDYVLSFGTDTSLTITKGWDHVTGFGVPNGLTFIQDAGK